MDATGQRWIAALSNYNFDIKYRSGKKKKNADADGLSRMEEEEKEQNVIFPEVLRAISQAVRATAENCPLVESVALTEDPIDCQKDIPERVLQATSLTDKDWRRSSRQDPTLNHAIQYLESGARKPASQIQASPIYDARYLTGTSFISEMAFCTEPGL